MIRKPYVAGQFYPGGSDDLRRSVQSYLKAELPRIRAVAVVVPHAGYRYSGRIAGEVYASVEIPATALLLGPAHGPIRPLFAVQAEGDWETPLGTASVDAGLAELVIRHVPGAEDYPRAHVREHSLEVQLPFLQAARPDIAFVPVSVSIQPRLEDLRAAGAGLARAVREAGRPVLLVASTDMSHYVTQAEAEALDGAAVDRMVALDPEGLVRTVLSLNISMCGMRPAAAVLFAARELGAERAELVRYGTSGEASGDFDQVVGYAGLRVPQPIS